MKKIIRQIAGTAGKRPASSILSDAFQYTPSHQTNLAAKFAEIRAAQESAKQPSIIVSISKRGVSK